MKASVTANADEWIVQRSVEARSLWAKSGTPEGHLTLPQHLIDSACVAEWLWDEWVSESLSATLGRLWGLDQDETRSLYCFLAGTHDLGKATVSFARMREDLEYLLYPIREAGLSLEWPWGEGEGIKFPHGVASALILREWLKEKGIPRPISGSLASVLDAHHGFASDPLMAKEFRDHLEEYDSKWRDVHRELVDSMAHLTNIDDVLGKLIDNDEQPFGDAAQLMTGLVIMADWIASNETAFPYSNGVSQRERVENAMRYIDLPAPWHPINGNDGVDDLFRTLFGWPDSFEARPAQLAAVDAARSLEGPGLIVIEAPTGVGKTEAGLAAAYVVGKQTGAQGVFVGAPTMATANGLFERTVEWVRCSSDSGQVSSMYLAHSKKNLNKAFSALKHSAAAGYYGGIGEDEGGDAKNDLAGDVIATQWLSGRKTGLLADFVVGTVDQLLMLALQSRHSMLRHVGFAGKVVIIDEVHAYDTYMSQYLYRTLEWLARYGVTVILMSATLPAKQRQKLAAAYASQLSEAAEEATSGSGMLDQRGYPVISSVDRNGVSVRVVPQGSNDLDASVDLIGDDLMVLRQKLKDLLRDGGVALIICNTIARSQETYDAVREDFGADVELHHAGFIAAQRSEKEDKMRNELGPARRRGEGRPLCKIVVATQVAEQSLDIDADVLITDIAPIDLIIQRAGRLHRHARPIEDRPGLLRRPRILVRGVDVDGDDPTLDSGAIAVYGERLLLATLAHLPDRFVRPADIENLVRDVYGDSPNIPETWGERWEKACAEDAARRNSAERRADGFRFPSPSHAEKLADLFARVHSERSDLPGDGDQKGLAQVRDAEPSIEAIAISSTDYGYCPLGIPDTEILEGTDPEWSAALALAGNTLRLPARISRRGSDFEEVITALEETTPGEWSQNHLLRGQVAIRFDAGGRAKLGRYLLTYTKEKGLQVAEAERN